jgi:hypothetical protein
MSVISTSASDVATEGRYEITDSRRANDPPVQGEAVALDRYIAGVLRRAHEAAEAADEPDEARAILHVAHAFADELAMMNPQFDRMRFIDAATTGPS